MHSKCHNATDPVTQNDYLAPVSNALYRRYLLWVVAPMFVCVCRGCLKPQTSRTIKVPSSAPACSAGRWGDGVFRWWAEIMN